MRFAIDVVIEIVKFFWGLVKIIFGLALFIFTICIGQIPD